MNSNIALLLKSKRKEQNLSVKEVREDLRNKGIDVSDKTIYGWENGHRQPDADTFVALCKIYKIESFSEVNSDEGDGLSCEERKHIKKYRALDGHGKEMVDIVLDKETERMVAEQQARTAELKAQRDRLEAEKERSKAPTLVSESGLDDSDEGLMEYLQRMAPDLKRYWFDQMRKSLKPQKEPLAVSAPPTVDDKTPKSERPDRS